MNTYMCKQCQSIWSDLEGHSSCPYCSEKTPVTPMSSEKSIRFRLLQSKGIWSLECKGSAEQTKQFIKVYWSEEPTEQLLYETLSEQLKRWLKE